jgi:hypothetical protein
MYPRFSVRHRRVVQCLTLILKILFPSGADAIDEAFLLVGFRKQSLYKPEPDKKLCVYIGWLFASALTDAIRGGTRIVYPYEELIVVRELQVSLASQKSSAHVITPIMFLSLFEVSQSIIAAANTRMTGASANGQDRSSDLVRMRQPIWRH